MADDKTKSGAYTIWEWSDTEIEHPKVLRKQLMDIHAQGYSGVLATLGTTRYEFLNKNVVRAIAQTSQWAKRRGVAFWFQADPRQASRTLITKTGERTQNLIVAEHPDHGLHDQMVNMAKVKKNRFELRYELPRDRFTPRIREQALHFEPAGLERVFLFKQNDGIIVGESVRDVTEFSHFYTNLKDGYAEVFGNVHVTEDETWYCIAFPKFDTNLYDFAGCQSNDLLLLFIEDLFDACSHLDGISWGEGEVGYVVDIGRFPVSLSLYNSFLAENRYDLRDVLYTLVMPVDDNSHAKVRYDYYSLLMETVFGAQKNFYQMIHSFFQGVDFGIHHTYHFNTNKVNDLVQGSIDPWRSLEQVSSAFLEMAPPQSPESQTEEFISSLIIAKSLGIYSVNQSAFLNIYESRKNPDLMNYWIDVMGLYSVQWLSRKACLDQKSLDDNSSNLDVKINRKISRLREITNFKFPESDVAVVYPAETIMSIGSQNAENLIQEFNTLTTRLVLAGFQLDVISTKLLRRIQISHEGVTIGHRCYRSIIFPYPEVVHPRVLDSLIKIEEAGIPLLFGGCTPTSTNRGKKIKKTFKIAFSPDDDDFTNLYISGIQRLIEFPDSGLATTINKGDTRLFLICPRRFGQTTEGEIKYNDICISVDKTATLSIYSTNLQGEKSRLL